MSIKTKHILAFLLASLLPLFCLFIVLWHQVSKALVGAAASQVDSIAEIQKDRVSAVLDRYALRARYTSSQPHLIRFLSEYLETGNQSAVRDLEAILLTLPRVVPTVRAVAIFSLAGEPIAAAGKIPDSSL